MYPEWIQEQLDRLREQPNPASKPFIATHHCGMHPESAEARIIHYISYRLDRIEAKIDRLLVFCEGE